LDSREWGGDKVFVRREREREREREEGGGGGRGRGGKRGIKMEFREEESSDLGELDQFYLV